MTTSRNQVWTRREGNSGSPVLIHPSTLRLARHSCSRSKPASPLSRQSNSERKDPVKHLPLVKQVAMEIRRNLPPQVELDDLIGDGTVGLMEAAAKFDASKGVDFNTYARHRIRGAILDALRKQDRASRGLRRRIKQAESAGRKVEARLARPATSEEIAHELSISFNEWYKLMAEAERASEAPSPFEETLEKRCSETRTTEGNIDAFQQCYRAEQQRVLAVALQCLEERERRMIQLYYFESRTMKEIGKSLGVDESRISQLHARAVKRLRECVQAVLGRSGVPACQAA